MIETTIIMTQMMSTNLKLKIHHQNKRTKKNNNNTFLSFSFSILGLNDSKSINKAKYTSHIFHTRESHFFVFVLLLFFLLLLNTRAALFSTHGLLKTSFMSQFNHSRSEILMERLTVFLLVSRVSHLDSTLQTQEAGTRAALGFTSTSRLGLRTSITTKVTLGLGASRGLAA